MLVPSRFSSAAAYSTLNDALGIIPTGAAGASSSMPLRPSHRSHSGSTAAGRQLSQRTDHTAPFSLRSSQFDGDDDGDADSRHLDEVSSAVSKLYMAGLHSIEGEDKRTQAEVLMQDLTELRLLGRGGCGTVYKVGRREVGEG